jgi:hypothetical protein
LTHLPVTKHEPWRWEPEPLRWIGFQYVRRGRRQLLESVERDGRYPAKPSLASRLWDAEPSLRGYANTLLARASGNGSRDGD